MNDISDKGVRFVRQISKLYADRYRFKWTKEGSVPSPNFSKPGLCKYTVVRGWETPNVQVGLKVEIHSVHSHKSAVLYTMFICSNEVLPIISLQLKNLHNLIYRIT